MVPIHTHPPNRAYDEGWDRIFGKKKSSKASATPLTGQELAEKYGFEPTPEWQARREALRKLTEDSQALGLYPEQDTPAAEQPVAALETAPETSNDTDRGTSAPGATQSGRSP